MNEIKHLESVISTTNSVLSEHIGMTRQMNIQLVELERKVEEQDKKLRQTHMFLIFEMILLWVFCIATIAGIVVLKG